VRRAPTGVDHLFDRTELLARRLLEKKQLTLERSPSPPALAASLDADLVCQVLLGLIANAAEATPPKGRVILEAAKNGEAIELSVADSGPGVPRELREKIFDPFVTTRSDGTGLGLAVARQIVEAHGGKIAVGEREGGGARFSIIFAGAAA
jgi:two-component system sensor histidine kinase FlrB